MVENALEEEDLIEKCVLALLSLVTLKKLLDLSGASVKVKVKLLNRV